MVVSVSALPDKPLLQAFAIFLLRLCRYMVLVLVFVSPLFAVANAYGAGLTDFDMSSIYGTVCLLLL